MRAYHLGDPDLDERIARLVADAAPDDTNADLIAEMIVTSLKLHRDDAGRGDLKLVNAALKEMRYSFQVFSRYREIRKVSVFGSARTRPDDPNYLLAAEFAARMSAGEGWMVITGAGPGTMEAANKGAGGDASFGVNIRLPFEAEANPYVDDARLINFKYFFTRKLMFVKESHAFALFPGGFGTQDETYELLTLTQTGKAPIHPIVLVEAPGTDYWEEWLDFVERTLVGHGMIAPEDLSLFSRATTVDEAAAVLTGFYRNYHSQRYVGDDLILRMHRPLGDAAIAALNEEFAAILASGVIAPVPPSDAEVRDGDGLDLARLRLHFDRRSHGLLRRLVDRINETPAGE